MFHLDLPLKVYEIRKEALNVYRLKQVKINLGRENRDIQIKNDRDTEKQREIEKKQRDKEKNRDVKNKNNQIQG